MEQTKKNAVVYGEDGSVQSVSFERGKAPHSVRKGVNNSYAKQQLKLGGWQETHHDGPLTGKHTVYYVHIQTTSGGYKSELK